MPPTNTDEGIRLAAELRRTHPEIGVVVLSQHADPVYAMALFVLGFGDTFADLVDASRDEQGLLLDAERVPKRVRARKVPAS